MLKDDLLQGAQAAADYTGLNRRTIYSLIASDSLKHTKIGKLLFFRKSELDAAFSSEQVA
jgi:excisionase family DNA binding protein